MSNVTIDGRPTIDDAPLAKSEVFDVLSNERRRLVLRYLDRTDGSADLGDLATQVAAWEYDVDPDELDADQRKRIYTTLQQTHLSMMDEVGIVDFDSERGVITATGRTQQLALYLEVVPKNELAWREYYLLLGLTGCSLALGIWAGLPGLTLVPAPVWMGIMGAVLCLSALLNRYHAHTTVLGDRSVRSVDRLGRSR